METNLNALLNECIKANSSDLHITAYSPPFIRVDGSLQPLEKHGELTPEQAKKICYEVLTHEMATKLERDLELDLSFTFEEKNRVRGNIFWQQNTVSGAFRVIPLEVPSGAELGVPEVVMQLTQKPRGLVLVTGPTGSGKSTTIAAMIEKINEEEKRHIITIEDPIEYIHFNKKCLINQREVGPDTLSFKNGLKYILRQDPDVVLIGEMRDLETIHSAITVAETGHLVFATLHTNDAAQTIDRIIDVFPPSNQPQIREQLALVLEGVICQQLVPMKDGGRTLAMEIMIPTSAIRNLIREGKTHQIYAQMQMGQKGTQMTTINQSLAALVKEKKITYEEGFYRCTNKEEFEQMAKH